MVLFLITICTICCSIVINWIILRFSNDYIDWIGDHTTGVQKIHTQPTPRIGGVSIYGAVLLTTLLAWFLNWTNPSSLVLWMSLCGLPLFIAGLTEDITKNVGVKIRLTFAFVAGFLAFYFVGAQITRLDIPLIDSLLGLSIVSPLFSAFAIAGLANAYNIIDGLNGLASMVAIITLGVLAIVSIAVGDGAVLLAVLMFLGALIGFFFFNYPQGRIFLGDCGAYFIGFWLALLSIMLVARNPSVSPWFAILVNSYPIVETLFSVWRRMVHQNRNPGLPDAAHFHSLVYRRFMMWSKRYLHHSQSPDQHYLTNARTSTYLWALSSMGSLPALLWWDSTPMLILSILAFIALYLFLYYRASPTKPKR
jgi:UDP-GlcNAc:undecaprenyl-phosphate GlcNAc-1-phosphate transferase